MSFDAINNALNVSVDSDLTISENEMVMSESPVKRREGRSQPTSGMIVDDFHYARENIHNAMEKSGALLESAMRAVVESGGAPRSIEVAAMLLKQCGDTSKELLNLAKLANELTNTENDTDEEKEKTLSMTAAQLSEMLDEKNDV